MRAERSRRPQLWRAAPGGRVISIPCRPPSPSRASPSPSAPRGIVILSLGLAPLFTLAADLAIGSAPPERAGAASGISETSSELGGALGLAILGTVGAAVYRDRAADTLPAELPARTAATAKETLAGAVEVADRMPHVLAADVLEPARQAFAHALQVAATLSGVLVVAAAVIVARLLRPGHEARDPEHGAAPPVAATQHSCA